jgi:hypothetical protein
MEPTRDEVNEVDDATAQLVEHVARIFSDSVHARERDATSERDYLDGTIEELVAERDVRQRALDAVRDALGRLEGTDGATAAARRRLVAAVQRDEAIGPIYRGLICAAIGAMDDAKLQSRSLHSVWILYPRVDFERGRCIFQTLIMLRCLVSASAWSEFKARKDRPSIPVPPSAIRPGLLGWMRAKGVAQLHVRADAYHGFPTAWAVTGRVLWTRAEADAFERVMDVDPYAYRMGGAEFVEYVDLLSDDDGATRGVLPYMRGVNEAALIDSFWRPVILRDENETRAQIELAHAYSHSRRNSAHRRAVWGPPRLD